MRALTFGFVVGLTLSTISACGSPKVSCSAATCSGCCMTDGTCQPGNQNVACGRAGGLCDVCSISASCQAGACVLVGNGGGSGGGTGGGATGGGTGGGGAAGCRNLGVFTEQQTVGQYVNSFFASAEARTSAAGTFNALIGAALLFHGAQVPGTGDLALPLNQDVNSAQYYAAYGENCTTSGGSSSCSATYVGVSGTLVAVDLLGTPDAGLFSVELQNVRFQRAGDGGVPDFSGDCVFLAHEAYTATWP